MKDGACTVVCASDMHRDIEADLLRGTQKDLL